MEICASKITELCEKAKKGGYIEDKCYKNTNLNSNKQ